jgi:putative tricarboxylic transport membrane protein
VTADLALGIAGELLDITTLSLIFVGVIAGIIAGAIPGFTITMAVVLTLPFTFGMNAVDGIATMMGVYVGGLSGGLLSGILIGIPGTPSSVATTFDGFPLARRGQPGYALGLGLWSSFFGGILGAVLLVILAPPLARIGLEFGPWDYFSLTMFALTITASLSGEALIKGLIAGVLGLFVATIGEDGINGIPRFTFGNDALLTGFSFLPVLVGLFAFSQLMSDVRDPDRARQPLLDARGRAPMRIEHLRAIREIGRQWVNLVRSTLIGVFTGALPAAGGAISNILAYDQAKKAARDQSTFGKGNPAGIIAPEASNNATAAGALIMMMALGIPGDVVTAVMLGALTIHNVVPSPTFIRDQPEIAYALFAAFFLAHFFMVGAQSVAIRGFLLLTRASMYVLGVVILIYCAIGTFALNNVGFDLWTLFLFGVLGYVMRLLGFPLAPMILGVILSGVAERNLSRAVTISDDYTLFLTRPFSLFFIVLGAFSILYPWYQKHCGTARWTDFYPAAATLALAPPLLMMPGDVRPVAGGLLVLLGAWLTWRAIRRPARPLTTGGAAR